MTLLSSFPVDLEILPLCMVAWCRLHRPCLMRTTPLGSQPFQAGFRVLRSGCQVVIPALLLSSSVALGKSTSSPWAPVSSFVKFRCYYFPHRGWEKQGLFLESPGPLSDAQRASGGCIWQGQCFASSISPKRCQTPRSPCASVAPLWVCHSVNVTFFFRWHCL